MFSSQHSIPKLHVGGGSGVSVAKALSCASSASASRGGGRRIDLSLGTVATAVAATVAAVGGAAYVYFTLRNRKRTVDDDDSDMFASPTGPRQLSPDAVPPNGRGGRKWGAGVPTSPTPAGAAAAAGNKAGTHLYPKEKAASRGRSRSQAAVASAEAASPGRARAAQAAGPAHGAKDKDGNEIFTEEIAERTKAMHLVRALLGRVEGLKYEDSSDGSDTDSDETDVSFNFHIATQLEASARDELMDAFAEYEMEMDGKVQRYEAGGHRNGASGDGTEGEEGAEELSDMAPVLVKMAEYLDISNEREKLRVRRDLLHTAAGSMHADRTHTRFVANAEQERERVTGSSTRETHLTRAKNGAVDRSRGGAAEASQTRAMERLMALVGATGAHFAQGNATAMDRALAADDADDADDADGLEDEWEDDDDAEEEAAFMEYLQQSDDASRFYSRQEVKDRRRDRQDPTAMRVVGIDGRDFDEVMEDGLEHRLSGGAVPRARRAIPRDYKSIDDDDGYDDDYFPQDTDAQEALYRRLMGFDSGEEDEDGYGYGYGDDDDADAVPWTDEEKAEFEANLMTRIHEMSELWGVTAAEGARELAKEEEEHRKRREERRAVKVADGARVAKGTAATVSTTAKQKSPSPAAAALATTHEHGDSNDEEEEWEDVDDEEGEVDGEEYYEDLPDDEETEEVPAAASARFRRDSGARHATRF